MEQGALLSCDENSLNASQLSDLLRALLQDEKIRLQMGEKLSDLIPRPSVETLLDCVRRATMV